MEIKQYVETPNGTVMAAERNILKNLANRVHELNSQLCKAWL